ncbi:dipeptidase [Acidomonas methanolica]|uniref:dipeptidase n=1 Tax=Acidomonas methanolica TaxID=437 RepID=UPI002119DEC2|nr:dipeptidase [Acidomonas methanolica]MCQ9154368.1 dipeptidase [Acidomonas methanolica]
MTDISPASLHDSLLTLDTHIDIPWPDRGDFRSGAADRQVDLPKLRRGGLKAVCLAAYIPQGRRTAAGHDQAWGRVQAMLGAIGGLEGDSVRVCGTAARTREAVAAGHVAILPAIENGYAVGEDPARVRALHALGARYMTLTHNGHNALADAAIPRADLDDPQELHGGLSALGRQVIAEMNACGMLVDVSHTSRKTMLQAVELSRAPVVASHSCARALCDHPRNLDDAQLDCLAESGGVVQVTAMSSFLKPSAQGVATVDDLAAHVAYIARRIGVAHVGISSDFDGGGRIEGWGDAAETPNVTSALQRQGFSAEEIAAIWGGNFLRLLERVEREAA